MQSKVAVLFIQDIGFDNLHTAQQCVLDTTGHNRITDKSCYVDVHPHNRRCHVSDMLGKFVTEHLSIIDPVRETRMHILC